MPHKLLPRSLVAAYVLPADDQALLQALRRAKHIIQSRFWSREIIPTESTPDADLRAIQDSWAPIDSDLTMLTLEFMKNGDMHHLIIKLAKTNDSVPQPILWRIFFCRESARSARPLLVLEGNLTDTVFTATISCQGLHSDVLPTEVPGARGRDRPARTAVEVGLWSGPRRDFAQPDREQHAAAWLEFHPL